MQKRVQISLIWHYAGFADLPEFDAQCGCTGPWKPPIEVGNVKPKFLPKLIQHVSGVPFLTGECLGLR
jgi:hypothetical protein